MKPRELLPLFVLNACNPGPHGWIDRAEEMPGIDVVKRIKSGHTGLDGNRSKTVTAILGSVQNETASALYRFEDEVETRSPNCEVKVELAGRYSYGEVTQGKPQFTVTCWEDYRPRSLSWDK